MKKMYKKLGVLACALTLSLGTFSGNIYASAAWSDNSTSTVKGYTYEFYAGVYNDSSDTWASTGITTDDNVPTGYMGALARLYDDSGILCKSSDWEYNDKPLAGMSRLTGRYSSKGTYYSYGEVKFFNGDGYTLRTTRRSPNLARSFAQYQINQNNETYGSGLGELITGEEPDLIHAYATNGRLGYVRSSDLDEKDYNTLEQVIIESKRQSKELKRTIPVYEKDGTTIIGVFDIESPAGENSIS